MQLIRAANTRTIGTVILAIIAVTTIAHGLPFGTSSPLLIDLRNSLHAPAFAILTSILMLILVQRYSLIIAVVCSSIVAFIAGMLGESMQFLSNGQTSLADLMSDAIGIFFGLCIGLFAIRRNKNNWNWRGKTALAALIIACTCIVIYPAFKAMRALVSQYHAMPTIMGFEKNWETTAYSAIRGASITLHPAPETWGDGHGNVAYVYIAGKRNSGLKVYPASNWSEFDYFAFTAASGGAGDFEISLRINDEDHNGNLHDRFGRQLTVSSEKQVYRIPISAIRNAPNGRKMDTANIHAIYFFVTQPTGNEILIIDNLRLEESK